MRHWQNINIPMMELAYESLVAQPEVSIKQLLDYCNLSWEDACLTPNQSGRVVKTASFQQVARPISQGSVNRWKHYHPYLEPLFQEFNACSQELDDLA